MSKLTESQIEALEKAFTKEQDELLENLGEFIGTMLDEVAGDEVDEDTRDEMREYLYGILKDAL